MKKLKISEVIFILISIGSFLLIRFARFDEIFRFVFDQALFSIKALEIFRSREITLIGPPTSFIFEGRQVFQGGIIYYTQMLFLLIANWDPYWATIFFTIFSGLMILPLYLGVRKLFNNYEAILMVGIYLGIPLFIDATRQMWNPYFQLSLTPLLIYIFSLFNQQKKWYQAFLTGVVAGILLMFHYQFILIMISLVIYVLMNGNNRISNFIGLFAGFVMGFSPLILFELRNDFYNIRTSWFLLTNWQQTLATRGTGLPLYYFASIILFLILPIFGKVSKWLNEKIIYLVFFSLVLLGFYTRVIYSGKEKLLSDWSYKDELKAYELIKNNLPNDSFNVSSFYDTQASSFKYFLLRDKIVYNSLDYYSNKYLFVIYPDENFSQNYAYELQPFKPKNIEKTWKINDKYSLYLAKRSN